MATVKCKRKKKNKGKLIFERKLVLNGVEKTVAEWLEAYKLKPSNLYTRLNLGWTLEEAITRPLAAPKDPIRVETRRKNFGSLKVDAYVENLESGMSIAEIAKKYNVTYATVSVSLRRRGIVGYAKKYK